MFVYALLAVIFSSLKRIGRTESHPDNLIIKECLERLIWWVPRCDMVEPILAISFKKNILACQFEVWILELQFQVYGF